MNERIRALGPWYQNIDLGNGVFTKAVEGAGEIFDGADIPRPLWDLLEPDLPPLAEKSVLDIGCNAGYMSIAAKRLGAESVVGIDNDQGMGEGGSFLDQARFCAEVLSLDVDFRAGSFVDLQERFDVVLFCGVLYHLEDWSGAFRKLSELVKPGGRLVLETEVGFPTEVFPGEKKFNGDSSTYFVPSPAMLQLLASEYGFMPQVTRHLGSRVLMHINL